MQLLQKLSCSQSVKSMGILQMIGLGSSSEVILLCSLLRSSLTAVGTVWTS